MARRSRRLPGLPCAAIKRREWLLQMLALGVRRVVAAPRLAPTCVGNTLIVGVRRIRDGRPLSADQIADRPRVPPSRSGRTKAGDQTGSVSR